MVGVSAKSGHRRRFCYHLELCLDLEPYNLLPKLFLILK